MDRISSVSLACIVIGGLLVMVSLGMAFINQAINPKLIVSIRLVAAGLVGFGGIGAILSIIE